MLTRTLNQNGIFIAALAFLLFAPIVNAQTPEFTYQGRLTDGGNPASATYDMQFKLFDTPDVGTGTPQGQNTRLVQVTNGVFTVQLNFGQNQFNGSPRYLEIGIRPPGSPDPYTVLAPRQPITSTPYAIRSLAANGLSAACVNCVTSNQILGVQGAQVTGEIPVASIPAGSANYIQNTTTQQSEANFNINGSGTADIFNAATQYNLGGSRVLSTAGTRNVFAGVGAGQANTLGTDNAFFGFNAGLNNTGNLSIGRRFNSFFGTNAGQSNTLGSLHVNGAFLLGGISPPAQYRNAAPCGKLHGFAGLLQSVSLIDIGGDCVTYHNPLTGQAYCDTNFLCSLAIGGVGHCTLDNSGQTCVCVPNPRGLSIAKTHSGNFFQGQTGAQYTITVSNDGSPTTGTVSVSDEVPAGLTATGIAGTNWTCTEPAGPCSRSDSLATGASYESITLTVDVAADAPSNVTNRATVSGTNVANGTAQDLTIINCHLVVDNNNDSGTGSLRDLIANACANSTITFAPNVRGAITLTTAELLINKNLTIIGPGANLLSVQRSAAGGTPAFRIFNITPASVIATISGLTIANGNTPSVGGGILSNGVATITNSTISGNTASSSSGGGIVNGSGTMTIINSTISGNSAGGGFGGGINSVAGTLTVTNSTISGNSVTDEQGISYGGGISNIGGTLTLTNSTISGNTAQYLGGGIVNSGGGTLRSKNTIIALNTAPPGAPDVFGPLTSQGFNLIGNKSGATITPTTGDQIGTPGSPINPLLGPLQDNGGPTFTRALLPGIPGIPGSPAIDKGHSSGSTTDQRGFTRPVDIPAIPNATGGDGGDIGAFETVACPFALSPHANFFPMSGGAGSVNVMATSFCSWTATVSDSWITLTSNDTGTGNEVVTFEVRENFTSSARQASINISGLNHIVVQDGGLGEDCGYSISPLFESFPVQGGSGTINVIAAERCAWQAVSSVSWVTITSISVGIGNGTVSYSLAANLGVSGRKGAILIGNQEFAVKQKGN
jgi:uncharacterized repeat protein (TIGR01451 family)